MKHRSLQAACFGSAIRLLTILLCCLLPLIGPSQTQAQSTDQSTEKSLEQVDVVKSLPSENKRWALLIGVDKYEDSTISPLRGAANDARALKDALVRYAGFPADQVIVLSTDEVPERQPSRRNILRRLSNLAGMVPRDGLLLVSFSGHGIEREGHPFLIPSDASLSEDVSLLEETAVSVSMVKQRIKQSGVKQVMILLDACRNYPTGRSDSSNPLTPSFTTGLDFDVRNHEVTAFAVLYATSVGFRAYEYGEKHQGYFTWAIVQALSGAAANAHGEVTLLALVKFLEDRVPRLVAIDYGAKVIQKPFADIEGYRADELVLAIAAPSTRVIQPSPVTNKPEVNAREKIENPRASEARPIKKRGTRSGNVVIMFALSEGNPRDIASKKILLAFSNEFADPLAALLSKAGLSAAVADLNLRKPDTKPYAVILLVTLSFSDMAPYNGLDVAEVNGSIQALDTDGGKTIARYTISRIRGFGNSEDQARRNALKNAAEEVSDSFIKQVAANAN